MAQGFKNFDEVVYYCFTSFGQSVISSILLIIHVDHTYIHGVLKERMEGGGMQTCKKVEVSPAEKGPT